MAVHHVWVLATTARRVCAGIVGTTEATAEATCNHTVHRESAVLREEGARREGSALCGGLEAWRMLCGSGGHRVEGALLLSVTVCYCLLLSVTVTDRVQDSAGDRSVRSLEQQHDRGRQRRARLVLLGCDKLHSAPA